MKQNLYMSLVVDGDMPIRVIARFKDETNRGNPKKLSSHYTQEMESGQARTQDELDLESFKLGTGTKIAKKQRISNMIKRIVEDEILYQKF